MIFVTVGTTDFDGLVRAADMLARDASERFVVQYGAGTYVPENCESFRFARSLHAYLSDADLVVSHGGLGTVVEVLLQGTPLVAVANPDRFDDHQEEILAEFAKKDHLVWCRDLGDLATAIVEAQTRVLSPYSSPSCWIAERVRDFLLRG
jgi:beta-1,4-N-acetylglucosaminyltransferase